MFDIIDEELTDRIITAMNGWGFKEPKALFVAATYLFSEYKPDEIAVKGMDGKFNVIEFKVEMNNEAQSSKDRH